MGTAYFLSGLFLLLSFWYIPEIPFIKRAQLTRKEVRFLLGFKMICGLACAFYFEKIASNVDYPFFNTEGQIQYKLLLSNPKLFFFDFSNDADAYGMGGLFDSKNSFWAYLRFNLVYKFIAILSLVTHGNFYLNTLIFCSIVFFGHIAFYRIYSEIYKEHKLKILFACFCLPSLILYTSCVNKDGIVFFSLGLISYVFYRILSSTRSINIKYTLFFLLGMIIIFLFRNYVIMALMPAMLTALFYKIFSYKKRLVLLISYSFFFLLFFLSGYSKSFLNLPAAVVNRKADFISIGAANTNIPMNDLSPTLKSFLHNLPQAINHYLFRPYLWEFRQLPVVLAAMELFFYHLIMLAFLFFNKKRLEPQDSFNVFGLIFVFNMMLIIGYTIPNVGAIVRYRSIFWIFLICPLLCNTDWKRLFSFHKTTTGTV